MKRCKSLCALLVATMMVGSSMPQTVLAAEAETDVIVEATEETAEELAEETVEAVAEEATEEAVIDEVTEKATEEAEEAEETTDETAMEEVAEEVTEVVTEDAEKELPVEEEIIESEDDIDVLAAGQDVTIGDYTYVINNGVASLKSYNGTASNITLPANFTFEGTKYVVKSVEPRAFDNNQTIKSVVIPKNYTTIGGAAFRYCANLESVTINANLADAHSYSCDTWSDRSAQNSVFFQSGGNADEFVVTFGPEVTRIPAFLFGTKENPDRSTCAKITKIVISDSVEAIGDFAFANCYYLKEISFSEGLKTIGNNAFLHAESLTEVTFPKSLDSIGEVAFGYNTALKKITVNQKSSLTIGNNAFGYCTKLNNPSLGGTKEIGAYAFQGCTSLETLVIPNKVTKVGNAAFRYCTALSDVTINGTLADCHGYSCDGWSDRSENYSVFFQAGTAADEMTVTFGPEVTRVAAFLFGTKENADKTTCAHVTKIVFSDSVTTVGEFAFANCYYLKEISFAEGMKNIDKNAFGHAESLTSVSFPKSLEGIGESAFAYNKALKKIVVNQKSSLSIGSYAFQYCNKLTDLQLGGTKEIGYQSFQGCTGLETLVIPNKVTKVDSGAFRYCTALSDITINGTLADCHGYSCDGWSDRSENYSVFFQAGSAADELTVTFGPEVIRVPSFLFGTKENDDRSTCAAVTKVVFSESVKSIGDYAFANCYYLNEIQFAKGMTEIGNYAFTHCYDLAELKLPETLEKIGEATFGYNKSLKKVVVPAKSSLKIGSFAFGYCAKLSDLQLGGTLEIGYQAFQGCIGLEKLIIPNKVTSVGGGAFRYCTNLTDITINGNIANCHGYSCDTWSDRSENYSIFFQAGSATENLKVTFGPEVTRIPSYLFGTKANDDRSTCARITKVVMSDTVETVGAYAFANCYYLEEVQFGAAVVKIENHAFVSNSSLAKMTLPETLETIEEYAFEGCSSLKKVTIPKKVGVLYDGAFYNCYGLEKVNIGTGIVSIPKKCFASCSALKEVVLSKKVTSIGNSAFADCTALSRVRATSNLTNIDNSAFNTFDNITFYCTAGSKLQEYATAHNAEFIEIVQVEFKFDDINANDWFVDFVQFAYDEGIMSGVSDTTFEPLKPLTRAQFATVLYGYEKKPDVVYKKKFTDVPQGKWYTNPILWAYNNGIVSGYQDGRYGVNDEINREQLALMLYKYAQLKEFDTTIDENILNGFKDQNKIDSWAKTALKWAVTNGIMSGKGEGKLDPLGKATRAECATMMNKLLTQNETED